MPLGFAACLSKNFNIEMLNKAEAIRCIRVTSLINEEFGFLDKHRMRQDFLAYFRKIADKKEDKTKPTVTSISVRTSMIILTASASLFSCLTGLRISDILNLKWEHI